MKNTFGQSITVTLFGESHGPAVGAVIDGLTPGLPVSEQEIARQLTRRRPSAAIDTARQEDDAFRILSGVFSGQTTGTPICIVIPNENTRSRDYTYGLARPAHADYTAFCKYHGYEDYRGGGHFSGRVTAALVAAGGIMIPALARIGIRIGTHMAVCAGIRDREFASFEQDISLLDSRSFPVLDADCEARMTDEILKAKQDGDSVGGITQTAVCGVNPGVGEPWFDSMESCLSHALFSLGGIKGVEFGDGFSITGMRGSEANDPLRIKDERVITTTNHNGGLNGGITNGMPILFRCAVKPTPSIAKEQNTVDFLKGEDSPLIIHGRHDPAIIRRICPVIDSVTAMVLCDMLAVRYGTDVFLKGVSSCNTD